MRYAYIKNGDVVQQYQRVLDTWDNLITSGPDAFIKSFIKSIGDDDLLLMSQSVEKSRLSGTKVKVITFFSGITTLQMLLFKPIAQLKMLCYLLMYRPHKILCGCTGGPLWMSYLAASLLRIPVVHSRHNRVASANDSLHRRVRSRIDTWLIRRMDAVVCHGPYLRQELLEVGVSPEVLFEFDIGFEDLLALSRGKADLENIYRGRTIILYIGRMERRKGIVDLFEACREHLQNHEDTCLVYFGDGSGKHELHQIVTQSGLDHSVFLEGLTPHDEIAGIIPYASVMVTPTQPSFPEGRCMSAMESLALGVPVIAPDFGPFPYLIKHDNNGMLYEPGSVLSLKKCVTKYLTDTDYQLQLKHGAEVTGRQLLIPALTFGKAVQAAYEQSSVPGK